MNPTYRTEHTVWSQSGRHQLELGLPDTRALVRSFLPDWTVERGRSDYGGRCYVDERRILIGWHAPRWVIWHEIAHGLPEGGGHNATFRRNYVQVVREAYSTRWADRLDRAFRDAGLSITPEGPKA
jgi:hypothetical protein